jgi:SSS family solute:Na+ symporter
MLANMLVRSSFPALLQSPINAGAFCMIAGLIIVPVVSMITPKPDAAVVDDAFACYDEKVLVAQKNALSDE